MLPKTIACTLTAVPFRPVMRSMRRYSIALLPFHELNTALIASIELLRRVLREVVADVLLVDGLVALDEFLEVVGGQVGVELDLLLVLELVDLVLEVLVLDAHRRQPNMSIRRR